MSTNTPKELANILSVTRAALKLTAEMKADAVKRGDFATSIRIANNEATIEARMRSLGIDLEEAP